ncbi:MAG: Putative membrane-bound redox modulator Alx [Holosporales bacterium]
MKWAIFSALCIAMLAFDLGVLHKKNHKVSFTKNAWISAFYIGISFAFGYYVYITQGAEKGHEFLTGYVIEKSLSLDNIFLIATIFNFFKIPETYQQRVLFWGILGAIIFRGILIYLGAAIVHEFGWILYIFSLFLIFTGIKILVMGNQEPDLSKSKMIKAFKKIMPVYPHVESENFFVPHAKKTRALIKTHAATPLFLALLLIEFTDVIFALDSVPAIFSITTDTYIVYTSNIFAILGLRSLYFVLQKMVDKFKYLKYSLAVLLLFIGSKIFIKDLLGVEKLNTEVVLYITAIIIIGGILPSFRRQK